MAHFDGQIVTEGGILERDFALRKCSWTSQMGDRMTLDPTSEVTGGRNDKKRFFLLLLQTPATALKAKASSRPPHGLLTASLLLFFSFCNKCCVLKIFLSIYIYISQTLMSVLVSVRNTNPQF